LFVRKGIVHNNDVLLPGSGVNLEAYLPMPYPSCDTIEFVFIARILKAKGIEEYLEAAHQIRERFPYARFHICGFCDQDYMGMIDEYVGKSDVIYHGMVDDTREIYKSTHCTVLPSWYSEGMNNVLLESAACARPIITTNRPGCGEIVDDGVNGFIVKQQDTEDLIRVMERFILMPDDEKKAMGLAGRRKVEQQFNREIVVEKYLEAINSLFV
jgi:galacturonosyltransferase